MERDVVIIVASFMTSPFVEKCPRLQYATSCKTTTFIRQWDTCLRGRRWKASDLECPYIYTAAVSHCLSDIVTGLARRAGRPAGRTEGTSGEKGVELYVGCDGSGRGSGRETRIDSLVALPGISVRATYSTGKVSVTTSREPEITLQSRHGLTRVSLTNCYVVNNLHCTPRLVSMANAWGKQKKTRAYKNSPVDSNARYASVTVVMRNLRLTCPVCGARANAMFRTHEVIKRLIDSRWIVTCPTSCAVHST